MRGSFSGIKLSNDEGPGAGCAVSVSNRAASGSGAVVIVHCASGPPQRCSPIMEISTCKPHAEHFIVGMKLDSRGIPAISALRFSEPVLDLVTLFPFSHAAAGCLSGAVAGWICCYSVDPGSTCRYLSKAHRKSSLMQALDVNGCCKGEMTVWLSRKPISLGRTEGQVFQILQAMARLEDRPSAMRRRVCWHKTAVNQRNKI